MIQSRRDVSEVASSLPCCRQQPTPMTAMTHQGESGAIGERLTSTNDAGNVQGNEFSGLRFFTATRHTRTVPTGLHACTVARALPRPPGSSYHRPLAFLFQPNPRRVPIAYTLIVRGHRWLVLFRCLGLILRLRLRLRVLPGAGAVRPGARRRRCRLRASAHCRANVSLATRPLFLARGCAPFPFSVARASPVFVPVSATVRPFVPVAPPVLHPGRPHDAWRPHDA